MVKFNLNRNDVESMCYMNIILELNSRALIFRGQAVEPTWLGAGPDHRQNEFRSGRDEPERVAGTFARCRVIRPNEDAGS